MTLEERLKEYQEKIKHNPLTCVIITIALLLFLLIVVPYVDISHRGINNATVEATLENQSRSTLAQILGGVAIAIGLYYTWRRINIAQEGQITERFTRAIDQLGAVDKDGNPAIEIRLGGIYALERIANESDKDYWPIMEILTAYVRKNSSAVLVKKKEIPYLDMDIQANESIKDEFSEEREISLDIQTVLSVIGKRRHSFNNGKNNRLSLYRSHLEWADLCGSHLERFDISGTYLECADLSDAHLEDADLPFSHLESAILFYTHLERAGLAFAHLECADLTYANLEEAYLRGVFLEGADLSSALLKGADLHEADLRGAKNLTVDQLSVVKTLYKAQLDEGLEAELRAKGFGYLLDNKPDEDEP